MSVFFNSPGSLHRFESSLGKPTQADVSLVVNELEALHNTLSKMVAMPVQRTPDNQTASDVLGEATKKVQAILASPSLDSGNNTESHEEKAPPSTRYHR